MGGLGLLLLPPKQGTKVGTRNQSPLLSPYELVHAPTICQGFPYVCRGSIPHLPQSQKEVNFKSLARRPLCTSSPRRDSTGQGLCRAFGQQAPAAAFSGNPLARIGPPVTGSLCQTSIPAPPIATWLAPRRSRSLLKRHLPAASLGFPTCKWRMASTPGTGGWHCPGLPITRKA